MSFELKTKRWEGDSQADSGAECPRRSCKGRGLAYIQNRGNEAEPRAGGERQEGDDLEKQAGLLRRTA